MYDFKMEDEELFNLEQLTAALEGKTYKEDLISSNIESFVRENEKKKQSDMGKKKIV